MKVLLATDGSTNAEAALEIVLYRPWSAGTEIRVLSVVEPLPAVLGAAFNLYGFGNTAMQAHKSLQSQMSGLQEIYRKRLDAKFGADKVSTKVLEGRDKVKIIEEAKSWGANLIIIGAHGQNESSEFLSGSVPDYVLHNAPCSVEILRSASLSTMITEIEREQPVEEDKYLIALDDSACSQMALSEFLGRKWPEKAFIKVLSVVEPLPYEAYSGLGPWEGINPQEMTELIDRTTAAQSEQAAKIVQEAVDKLKAAMPSAQVSAEVLEGKPRERILNCAREWPADLIVMGSHGRRGFQEFIMGSVSKATATHSPCSICVVRSGK